MQFPQDFGETAVRLEAPYLFPPFRLDPANERLYRDDRVVALRPKSFAVLRHLLLHSGKLVTKSELLEVVWPDVSVGDAVLTGCIREIREALGDDPLAPRFIETAHRRGYRFVGSTAAKPEGGPPRQPVETCVGRERELARLQDSLHHAARGERQVIFISGEPGIGKTTLVQGFLERITDISGVVVGHGQCLEHYGAGEAYLPVLEALGGLSRQPLGGRLVAVFKQYAPTWLAQMPALIEQGDVAALQRQVTGATPHRMLREMAEAIEALTKETSLVLVLEDLHWSDFSTLDLLASLAERREAVRLLVIGTYRPDDVEVSRHPLREVKQRLEMHRRSIELRLTALTEAGVAAYIDARFGRHRFPVELPQFIHRRTEGLPLFMVHVVDDLLTAGAIAPAAEGWELGVAPEEIARALPETVRLMIDRQIDRLSADKLRVMEAASVSGMEFSSAIVAAATDDEPEHVEAWSDRLVREHRFIERLTAGEFPDGTVSVRYRFIHALHQNAVYEHIAVTRRAVLHRRVGNAIEALYGERAGEVAAELAIHFEQAREQAKAATYFAKAASNAAVRSANQEVVSLADRGLRALAHLPDSTERARQELALQMVLGAALIATKGYAAPEVERAYGRARELCPLAGDTPELFRVLWGLARFYLVRTPLVVSREIGAEMLHLAERAQDPDLLEQAHNSFGATLFHMGEFEAARRHLEQGIALYAPERHHSHVLQYVQDPGVVCLIRVSVALWCLGYPDQSVRRAHEALALARTLAHPFSEAFATSFAALLFEMRQEWHNAKKWAEVAISLSAPHGFTALLIMGQLLRAAATTALDPGAEEDRAQIRTVVDTIRALGTELLGVYGMAILASACARARQFDEASSWIDEALARLPHSGERFYEAELHRLRGQLLLDVAGEDAYPRAEASFRSAIDIAGAQHAKSWELRAAVSLAKLYQTQKRPEEARSVVLQRYAWFTEGFDTADLQAARAVLEECHV